MNGSCGPVYFFLRSAPLECSTYLLGFFDVTNKEVLVLLGIERGGRNIPHSRLDLGDNRVEL